MSAVGSSVQVRQLALRPGTPVLVRSPGVLQVGLDQPRLQLPDHPDVRRLLGLLARPTGASLEECDAWVDLVARLDRVGLLVDPFASVPAALSAQHGPHAVRRQAVLRTGSVTLWADGAAEPSTRAALTAAGLRIAPHGAPGTLTLVVATGPIARERLDPLVRSSRPHLVVEGAAAGVRVGPFVSPGRTACLRCIDSYESERDPRRPLLLVQAAAAAVAHPPPRDALLDRIALSLAARDLALYLAGDEPVTWSATIDVRADNGPAAGEAAGPMLSSWQRHPWCGCAWDAVLDLP